MYKRQIGDYTRHLLPYLREHCDVDLYVEVGRAETDPGGDAYRGVDELRPREYDQVLYQLGNEQNHGFMVRLVRALGGTVMQHDWVLFDLALAAFPALARGGAKGHALALREGGLGQLRAYLRNWLDRRAQREVPLPDLDLGGLEGSLLTGWHAHEGEGRWTADRAVLRLPAPGARRVRVHLSAEPDRRVTLELGGPAGGEVLARAPAGGGRLEALLPAGDRSAGPLVALRTEGVRVTREQRRHGDSRRLGCFVHEVQWQDGEGWHALDLEQPAAVPVAPVTLSRDRFVLPLNRSVVRFADAFIVHSRYVKDRILRERNSLTPVGILPHGAERRWRDEDRRETRRRLGLPEAFLDGFLVSAFGGVQRHKRLDRLMAGVALARRSRADVRLLLAGGYDPHDFDPVAVARRMGLADAVHVMGYVSEETAWDCIHAGDVCANLRGPTSGGTSGGIYQSLAFGRPVVATDAGEQAELPDACIPKVPLGEGEVESIGALLVKLRDDPAARAELERAARAYVDEECHWSHTARTYARYLGEFPGPRATRKSLIGMRLEMARKQRESASESAPKSPQESTG